jgi:gas vesicle protein
MADKLVKRTPSGLTYVFSGMLVCPECGRKLGGCYNARGVGRSEKIATYRCAKNLKSKTCSFNKAIMEKTIENYLFQNILKELDKYKEDYDFRVSEKKKQKKAGTPEKAIEKIKKKLSKLKELYINEMIDIQEYKKDYDDLNRQLADLEAQIATEEEPVDIEAIKNLLSKSTEEIYQTLTAEDRRKFWRSFIDHIVVHSRDNMEIYFLRKDTY